MLLGGSSATRGRRWVNEDFLTGEEASFPLSSTARASCRSQPRKTTRRATTATWGPTGRHGALLARSRGHARSADRVMREIVLPTVRWPSAANGIHYRGFPLLPAS